jgi:hypothetical protein
VVFNFTLTFAELSFEQELQQGCAKVKSDAVLGQNIMIKNNTTKPFHILNVKPPGHNFASSMRKIVIIIRLMTAISRLLKIMSV